MSSPIMIATVDVQYGLTMAASACVTFHAWSDATAAGEVTSLVAEPAPYISGELWRRELPCVLAVLGVLDSAPTMIVIDGYVWLDGSDRPGLGAHLFDALDGRTPVIGVAKTAFRGSQHACRAYRGASKQPLYVTSRGIAPEDAAEAIEAMHGQYRLPTLLKRVDRLCRDALIASEAHGAR